MTGARFKRFLLGYLAVAMIVLGLIGTNAFYPGGVLALPGVPGGGEQSSDVLDASAARITYVDTGVKTPAASLAVTSVPKCGYGKYNRFKFELRVTALTGTSPTLNGAILNSLDGVNYNTVATFVAVDATTVTTPVNQLQSYSVGETENTANPVIYGDCWKTSVTLGGTSPGANYGIKGFDQ